MADNTTFTGMGALPFMRKYPLIPGGGDTATKMHGYSRVGRDKRVLYMECSAM